MSADKRQLYVMNVSFELLLEFTDFDGGEAVQQYMNKGSYCFSNAIAQLADEEMRGDGCCFSCHRATARFVRVATPEDIENLTPPKPKE